jgi:hypothetical protein
MMTASSARLRRARVPVEIPRVASAAAGRIANAPRLPMPHAERKPSILPQVNMEVQVCRNSSARAARAQEDGEEQICCCPWI